MKVTTRFALQRNDDKRVQGKTRPCLKLRWGSVRQLKIDCRLIQVKPHVSTVLGTVI